MLTTDGLADDVGRLLGPNERRGMLIPGLDVAKDVLDQGTDGVERASANRLLGQDAEPGLDQVDPRSSFGGEVEVDPGTLFQPFTHRRSGVRRGVVDDDVQLLLGVTALHAVEEADEVETGVALATLAEDAATGDPQRRIEAGQPIAAEVVAFAGRHSGSQGRPR